MSESAITKTVTMWPQTVHCVEHLQEKMRALSFSDAIRGAIELSSLLVNSVEHGKRVIIEDEHGRQKQILIPGIHG